MQQHYVLPSWPAIQDVPWSRRCFDGEEETAQDPNNFHISSTQGAGEGFPGITFLKFCVNPSILEQNLKVVSTGNSLPGHLHARGDCHEDRPH